MFVGSWTSFTTSLSIPPCSCGNRRPNSWDSRSCTQWRIQGGGTQGTFPPLELSNALLLGRGLAVATYISLTSHLLPPESRLLASYTTHWSIVREQYYVATPTIILYSQDVPPPFWKSWIRPWYRMRNGSVVWPVTRQYIVGMVPHICMPCMRLGLPTVHVWISFCGFILSYLAGYIDSATIISFHWH